MPRTVAAQRGSEPAGSTTTAPGVDAALHLPPQTVSWLADHPQARQFVDSVWDKLTELDRAGQYPAPSTRCVGS